MDKKDNLNTTPPISTNNSHNNSQKSEPVNNATEMVDDLIKNSGVKEIGYSVEVYDYLVFANGLPNVRVNELVVSQNGYRGIVFGLDNDLVQILMLDDVKIKPKETFFRTNQQFAISPGRHLLGRTINPLGIPIDGKHRFPKGSDSLSIDGRVPGLSEREFIKEQYITGVTTVDMLIPLARGQRELIIGDARSGKSSFLIDVLINQKVHASKQICIIGLIGKPAIEVNRFVSVLESNGVTDYSCVIAASSSERAPLIYLTPYVAITVAEYFQKQGYDVLLILDDLGMHAKLYREISLLSDKSPGRESYPGDIFYQQARLMERAGNFNSENGGGSITALPVIEIGADDITGFMQTNLMGMTDGHLLFSSNLYHQGTRPAIDIPLSVSRVGRQTQSILQKLLADKVKGVLADARKYENLSRFGSDLSDETKLILLQSKHIENILKQEQLELVPKMVQILLLGLVFTPFLVDKDSGFLLKFKKEIINYLLKIKLEEVSNQIEKMNNLEQFFEYIKPMVMELGKVIAKS